MMQLSKQVNDILRELEEKLSQLNDLENELNSQKNLKTHWKNKMLDRINKQKKQINLMMDLYADYESIMSKLPSAGHSSGIEQTK